MAKEKKALLVHLESAVPAFIDVCKNCKAVNILIPADGEESPEQRIFCPHVALVTPAKKGFMFVYAEPDSIPEKAVKGKPPEPPAAPPAA